MSPLSRPDPTPEILGSSRAYTSAYGANSIRRETMPRDNIQSSGAIATAGRAFLRRISLVPGSYTTVSAWLSTATTPATLANCYLGLYDSNGSNGAPSARVAVSAESAAQTFFIGDGTSRIVTLTLNYTCTAPNDFFLAILIGSFGTAPSYGRGASGLSGTPALDPVVLASTSSSSLTSLPDPIGTLGAASGSQVNYWFRYE